MTSTKSEIFDHWSCLNTYLLVICLWIMFVNLVSFFVFVRLLVAWFITQQPQPNSPFQGIESQNFQLEAFWANWPWWMISQGMSRSCLGWHFWWDSNTPPKWNSKSPWKSYHPQREICQKKHHFSRGSVKLPGGMGCFVLFLLYKRLVSLEKTDFI